MRRQDANFDRMRPVFALFVLMAATATPAAAWDAPEEITGAYALATTSGDAACELELLAPIAREFEGVWYVARPLHYEDNRAACRGLGLDDVVAWSGVRGTSLWLLAEGEAGFMEFAPAEHGWRLVKSGHDARPDLVLTRTGNID